MLISWLRPLYEESDPPSSGDGKTPDPPPAPAPQSEADDFDRDRAMATIKSLRAFEKDAKAKLKRLEELEAADTTRKQAEMTELDRVKAQLADLQSQHEQANAALRASRVKDAVRSAAQAASLTFAPGALDDAVALGLFADLDVGDDGKVKGVGEHLRELHKSRPYLFVTAQATPPDIGATKSGRDSNEPDRARLAQRFGIRVQG